jgi:serine phosphatase RsbU (regulator of sigma subunit)
MALRFRTRLNLTISALVFLVVTAMTVVILVIYGIDNWTANWRAGAAMTTITTMNMNHAVNVPPFVQRRLADQMELQGTLVAEITALSEASGEPAEALSARLARALDDANSADSGLALDGIVVTDPLGRSLAEAGQPVAASRDAPPMQPGEPARSVSHGSRPDLVQDQYIYVPLPHRAGTVQLSVSGERLTELLKPLSLENALQNFMVTGQFGNQYKRMAVVDRQGNVRAAVHREDVAESPQTTRNLARFCAGFLADLPENPEERYATRFVGRDVGVVTVLYYEPTGEEFALYIEHDTSGQIAYMLDRLGWLAIVGALMFMLAVITSIFLSRGLSKPLIELARGAREFGAGNLSYRLRMRRKDEFNELAQSFNAMAISIQEYVHELSEESARRERLESEFRIAAELQRTLLPEAPPEVESVHLTGWSQASKEVGGDFYDYIELPDGKVAIVVGDATGKGLSAALLSTQCASILRTLAGQGLAPDELLSRTNAEFYKRIGATHRFVTLFLLTVDPRTREATYSSAGHPPALLARADTGQVQWLECEAGYPLGIVPEAAFGRETITLGPRDTIVVYSDGLTDAKNPAEEMFGDRRLEEAVRNAGECGTEELMHELRSRAAAHMNGKDPIDDMTVVIFQFEPAEAAAVRSA